AGSVSGGGAAVVTGTSRMGMGTVVGCDGAGCQVNHTRPGTHHRVTVPVRGMPLAAAAAMVSSLSTRSIHTTSLKHRAASDGLMPLATRSVLPRRRNAGTVYSSTM